MSSVTDKGRSSSVEEREEEEEEGGGGGGGSAPSLPLSPPLSLSRSPSRSLSLLSSVQDAGHSRSPRC